MTVIDQDGAEQRWHAVYWRHYVRREHPCDSFAEAWAFLDSGENYGELSGEAVRTPEGVEVPFKYGDEMPEEYRAEKPDEPPSVTNVASLR